MRRCFELAKQGAGQVSPNPMVGSVIVHKGEIIGEGFHTQYGEAHAEPNAINSVEDEALLSQSTLYVNLEPCSHFGETPPCASLIIEKKIPRVVIANADPFPEVSGRGIKMLREMGVEVVVNVLDQEGEELNKRFFTFHREKRPYIFLKWAQSADGFIDGIRINENTAPIHFSSPETLKRNHQKRAEEDAIIVGKNTVLLDNPRLTNRLSSGKTPLRITIDREGILTSEFHLLDKSVSSLIFTQLDKKDEKNLSFVSLDFSENIISQILEELYQRRILSLIVEGGAILLQSFIDSGYWDEAQVEISPLCLKNGVKAPGIGKFSSKEETLLSENRFIFYRK